MYEVENKKIKDYVGTLSITKQEMFKFLINSIPDNMLVIDGEENTDLLVLAIVLAEVLGDSKELIVGLEDAHDLPALINNIISEKDEDLKYSKQKLLALKADEVGFDIDFNKVDNTQYLDGLNKYFGLILNNYNNTKNRGSNSALYNLLKDYYKIDNRVNFPEITILEAGAEDEYSDEELDLGNVRIYFDELPPDFADTQNDFDVSGGYYYLRGDTELYNLIMKIKPAGIIYELIVKATIKSLYITFPSIASGDSVVYNDDTIEDGFKKPLDLSVSNKSMEITFEDNITSVENIKAIGKFKTNTAYDYEWAINNVPKDIKENNYPDSSGIETKDSDEISYPVNSTGKVTAKLTVLDRYNYNINDTIEAFEYIPEVVAKKDFEVSTTKGKGFLTVKCDNKLTRQQAKSVVLKVYRNDYFNDGEVYEKSANNISQGTSRDLIFNNNLDKAIHGNLKTTWTINRNGKTKDFRLDDKSVIIPDIYGRQYFVLIVEDIEIDDNFKVSFNVINPNDFKVNLKATFGWQIYNITSNSWISDNTANNSSQSQTLDIRSNSNSFSRTIVSSGTYPIDNRDKKKRATVSFEITKSDSNTPDQYINSVYEVPLKTTEAVEPIKVEVDTFNYESAKRKNGSNLNDVEVLFYKTQNNILLDKVTESLEYIDTSITLKDYGVDINLNNTEVSSSSPLIDIKKGNNVIASIGSNKIKIDSDNPSYPTNFKYKPKSDNYFDITYGVVPSDSRIEISTILNVTPDIGTPPKYFGDKNKLYRTALTNMRAPAVTIENAVIKFPLNVQDGDITSYGNVKNNTNKKLNIKVTSQNIFSSLFTTEINDLSLNSTSSYTTSPVHGGLSWESTIGPYFNNNIHNVGSTIPGMVVAASIDTSDTTKPAGFSEKIGYDVEFTKYERPKFVRYELYYDDVYYVDIKNNNSVPVTLYILDQNNNSSILTTMTSEETKRVEVSTNLYGMQPRVLFKDYTPLISTIRGADSDTTIISID